MKCVNSELANLGNQLSGLFGRRRDLLGNLTNLVGWTAGMVVQWAGDAAFVHYFLRQPQKKLGNFFPPVLGFLMCLSLWLHLSPKAKIAGSIWMAVGIAFGAWKTRGFRGELVNFELPPEDAEAS